MGGRGTKSGQKGVVNPNKGRGGRRQDVPVPNVSYDQALGKRGDSAIRTIAEDNSNPNFSKGTFAWTHNCQRCVWAYEMQRRGYNVEAKARPQTADQYCFLDGIEAMAGRQFQQMGGATVDNTVYNIAETMAKNGEGSRAFVTCFWNNGGGHIFMCENIGGTTVFIDPQTHKTVDPEKTFNRAVLSSVQIMRVDDINLNSIKAGDLYNVVQPSKTNVSHQRKQ